MNIDEIDQKFVRFGKNSGIACAASILKYFNIDIKTDMLEELIELDEKGNTSLVDIATALESFGLITEGFQADAIVNMEGLSNPAIIPVFSDEGQNDFAIYYGKYKSKYLIGMPTWGLNLYTEWEFEAIWDNNILLVVRKF